MACLLNVPGDGGFLWKTGLVIGQPSLLNFIYVAIYLCTYVCYVLGNPFFRKISLAKPKKHFEIEYAFYLPLPLKSTNETTSVLLSSPPI